MSEGTGSQDKTDAISESQTLKLVLRVLLGGSLCMLAGTIIAIESYKALGVFESLKATGIYDSAIVAGAGLTVFWPFTVIRPKGWLQLPGFFLASIPFVVWYSIAGTLAGLAGWQLSLEAGHTVIVVALVLLVAPAIQLHIALFRRFGMVPEVSSDAKAEISPSDLLHETASVLPGFLLVFLLTDLLQASGLASSYPKIPWEMMVIATFPSAIVAFGASPRTRRQRIKLAAIIAGMMVGAALLAVVAVLLVATFISEQMAILGMFAVVLVSTPLSKRLVASMKGRADPDGLWPPESES